MKKGVSNPLSLNSDFFLKVRRRGLQLLSEELVISELIEEGL